MSKNLHFDLTQRVQSWTSSRATGAGFNWATEVFLAPGYVADAVVIASLQNRYWLATGGGGHELAPDPQAATEPTAQSDEEFSEFNITFPAPRVGQHPIPERLVIVFETKISRSDFLATFHQERNGNRRSPIGNLHYLVIPPNLSCTDHLPEWWGILQQSRRGLREIRPATFNPIPDQDLYHAAFRVLLASYRNPPRFVQAQPDGGLLVWETTSPVNHSNKKERRAINS
jgi:hypothetical protein